MLCSVLYPNRLQQNEEKTRLNPTEELEPELTLVKKIPKPPIMERINGDQKRKTIKQEK